MPSLQGNWSGTFSSTAGALTISAVLIQGNLDQQGFPTLSGKVTVTAKISVLAGKSRVPS